MTATQPPPEFDMVLCCTVAIVVFLFVFILCGN